MTERRSQVGLEMTIDKPWDFFIVCEITLERFHYVFWRYWPVAPLYELRKLV